MTLISVHGLQGGAAASLQHLLGLLASVLAQAVLTLGAVVLCIHIDADVALHITAHRVVTQMLDCIQGITPAADEVTQVLTHQLHMVCIILALNGMGLGLRAHVLQQALQELLDLLLHGAGLGGSVNLRLLGLLHSLRLALGTRLALSLGCFGLNLGFLGLHRLSLGSLHLGSLYLGCLGLLHRRSGLGLASGSTAQGALGSGRGQVRSLVGHLNLGRLGAEAQKTGLGLLQHLDRNTVPIQAQLSKRCLNGKIDGLAGSHDGLFHISYSSV